MVDVNLKVPALEKLMDYTASGIGAIAGPMLAPWKAGREAKAKLIEAKGQADRLKPIADAQAEARRYLVESDGAGGGTLEIDSNGITQRIEFQEKKRQANIAATVRQAAAELGDTEVPEHEPDPDWTARFFDCVQDVPKRTIMGTDDIRLEGRDGRLGSVMIAVVVTGTKGKEYRLPEAEEIAAAEVSADELDELYGRIPFGLPTEAICAERPSPNSRGASGLPRYGLDQWRDTFTDRQTLALGIFAHQTRLLPQAMDGVSENWQETITALNALCLDRLADYSSAICSWHKGRETLSHTFARFALPMVWDYAEVNPL